MTRRGRLKVYLGFAPGVGKTYAMLSEAHDLAADGTDVLVGVVEDHGRARTAARVEGLKVLPRRKVVYRGNEFGELDVDAVLKAAPQVVLVDELAHTVVQEDPQPEESSDSTPALVALDPEYPGARGAKAVETPSPEEAPTKRWHDVYTLLDAGIDVISTLNIQHLESLNDVVAAVTGTRQRETVPDQVLRDADEVELVDLSPDALRIRLARGDIYRAEQAQQALQKYFRTSNLNSLRELALLWLADKVEEGLERYRDEEKIKDNWPTRERVVVAVAGTPESDVLLRRGARIAGRVAGREMIAVHVASDDGLARGVDSDHNGLQRLQDLTEDLGGQWRVVVGDDVAGTLLEFARNVNASQLVIGLGRRRSRLLGGGLNSRIIDAAGSIDVHIVSDNARKTPRREEAKAAKPRAPKLSTARVAAGWGIAVLGPLLLTFLVAKLHPGQEYLGPILLGYLTLSVFAALAGGLWPAIFAVVLGSLLANWFFTEPVHTLTVTSPESLLGIGLFLVIALAVAWIVEVAERRSAEARARTTHAVIMGELASGVINEGDNLRELLRRLRDTFGLTRVDLQRYSPERKKWTAVETSADGGLSEPWPARGCQKSHVGAGDGLRLIVGGRSLTSVETAMIEAHGARITGIINRQQIDAMRRATAALAAGNRVGTALLAAVSHDLRTPLAGIKAAVSGLTLDDVELPEDARRSLLETIESGADRLETVIGNLLDMSRLNSNAVQVSRRPVVVADVVDAVRDELPEASGYVDSDLDEDLPPVIGDYGLIQRILANLVINGRTHAPASRLLITAQADGPRVVISVIDHGPGIPADRKGDLFVPFQRLGDSSGGGLGLGLAVAHGFAEAMGGNLAAEDTPGGGTTMRLELPAKVRKEVSA